MAANEVYRLLHLQSLTELYSQVASGRMKRTRDSVLNSRTYLDELYGVFNQVRVNYAHNLKKISKSRRILNKKTVTFLAHNGKTVACFISANTGLYGSLVRDVFNEFLKEVKSGKVEATIIGKLGLSMFKTIMGDDYPLTYFDFPDDEVDKEALQKILVHLVPYEQIDVYYGQFITVFRQKPESFPLSSKVVTDNQAVKERISYIFEPSLESVLQHFEKEIFATLFEQKVKENQLAKYAARVVAMDQASSRIDNEIGKAEIRLRQEFHRELNRSQQNQLTSVLFRK